MRRRVSKTRRTPSIETISYEYDNAGNRTKVTENGEITTYEYNGFNQITSSVTKKQAEGVEGNEEGESSEVEDSAAVIFHESGYIQRRQIENRDLKLLESLSEKLNTSRS